MNLMEAMREFCLQHGSDKTFCIAYSGGLDSHVLLSLFHELRDELSLSIRAIHVNHGLSANAHQWSEHCSQVCAAYHIPFDHFIIDLKSNSTQNPPNLEALARTQRYGVIAANLTPTDILVTAHHQDDQAETYLLQLLRGAGVKGLAAMPLTKQFAQSSQARPLLAFSRDELLHYAREKNLQWVDDESNHNIHLARNFLRHEILPVLKKHWPQAKQTIARAADQSAEAQALLEDYGKLLLQQVQGIRAQTLSVTKLLALQPKQQRLVLRTWIASLHFSLPSSDKLATIQNTVLTAGWDKSPLVSWHQTELRRHRDDLFLLQPKLPPQIEFPIEWDLTQSLPLPGLGVLTPTVKQGCGIKVGVGPLKVALRQGGEIVNLPKRGRHSFKTLLQEWQVLPWERDRIPLLFAHDKLIAALGYFIDPDFAAARGEAGIEIIFERNE